MQEFTHLATLRMQDFTVYASASHAVYRGGWSKGENQRFFNRKKISWMFFWNDIPEIKITIIETLL